jgi:FPC/CPF motif-containing protein YcgG
MNPDDDIINQYWNFLNQKGFPCVAAKAALARGHIKSIVIGHMACPVHDSQILNFMYNFVDNYRSAGNSYHSAAVIFKEPLHVDEVGFDQLLWQRLKGLSALDKVRYTHDPRVDADPSSPRYSFSLKEEAFFIVGIHPASERKSRRFKYPALIFNPHAEFEKLRRLKRYDKMKEVVRKRDVFYSGSVNPMLDDFGNSSEVNQYSGMRHDSNWTCPLSH